MRNGRGFRVNCCWHARCPGGHGNRYDSAIVKWFDGVGFVTGTRDGSDDGRVLVDLTVSGRGYEIEVRKSTSKIKSACGFTEQRVDDVHHILEALAQPVGGEVAKSFKEI